MGLTNEVLGNGNRKRQTDMPDERYFPSVFSNIALSSG